MKILKKNKIEYVVVFLILMIMMLSTITVYGGDLASAKIVTGTKKLITDGTAVLTGLVAGVCTIFAIINAVKYATADPDHKPKHKKALTDLLIGTVVAATIGSIITVLLSYFL